MRVLNLGPSDAAGVQVTDTLPSGFTPTGITDSQGNCIALPCTLGTLAAGADAYVFIEGMVDPLLSLPLVNAASVTATTPLTDVGQAQTVITTPVIAEADLKIILQARQRRLPA